MESFADRLTKLAERRDSALVVGMDPMPAALPPELVPAEQTPAELARAFVAFSAGILEAVVPHAVAVKFQSAFYERLGPAGAEALLQSLARARELGLLTIVDAKRGDIGSTAEAYAEAYLGDLPGTFGPLVDAITVNPYLGDDGVRPFVDCAKARGKGLFVLVKTSNPSGPRFQDLVCDGRPLYAHVADLVRSLGFELVGDCGLSGLGAVVGATYADVLGELRRLLPTNLLLLPGVGAQGASVKSLGPAFLPGRRGALVTASRSILYAYRARQKLSWQEAAAAEAEDLVRSLRELPR
jgi:orotidine-5'-phosphate decarboxylase